MNVPCKDCPDRHLACHDTCERYKAFAAWRAEVLEKQRAQSEAEHGCRVLAANWGKGWEYEKKRKKRR